MATVLYVDDEAALRRAVHAWLERRGDEVCSARTIGGAKEQLAERAFDGVFIDLWLPDGSGFELFDWIAERDGALAERVAFVTGDIIPSPSTARQLSMLGRPVLVKPFDLAELERQVRGWTEARAGAAEQRPLAERGGAGEQPEAPA
ncbi:MAG: response regulator [Gemmatimonadaceae bacterium]